MVLTANLVTATAEMHVGTVDLVAATTNLHARIDYLVSTTTDLHAGRVGLVVLGGWRIERIVMVVGQTWILGGGGGGRGCKQRGGGGAVETDEKTRILGGSGYGR